MNTALLQISLEIPSSDMSLIEAIAQRMGWRMTSNNHSNEGQKHVQYSDRINHLRSLKGKGIDQTDIDNDERLRYLLNK